MIEESLVDRLRENRKKMDELTRELSIDMIDDNHLDSATLTRLMMSVSSCMSSVSRLFKRSENIPTDDTVTNAVALMHSGKSRDGLMMLNRLARESNVDAQLKIAELHCLGLCGQPIEGQNSNYGLKVLDSLLIKEVPAAHYTMGVFQKRIPDIDSALYHFECSYQFGVQKAFPELIAIYKGRIKEESSIEKKLLFTQKLNNIKSELIYE